MGLWKKLFGGDAEPPDAEAAPVEPPLLAVAVCRHGMNLPSDAELAAVLGLAYPGGLAPEVARIGLSQPSWFKNQEIAESAAADVAQALRHKLSLSGGSHRYRILDRHGAAKIMLVELVKAE
jgi:hypothetical protein